MLWLAPQSCLSLWAEQDQGSRSSSPNPCTSGPIPKPAGARGWEIDKLSTRPPAAPHPLQWLGRILAKAGHQDQGGRPPPKRGVMGRVPGTPDNRAGQEIKGWAGHPPRKGGTGGLSMLSENWRGGWGLAILRTQPALGHPRLLFLRPVNPVDLLGGKPVLVPPSVGFSSQPGCNPKSSPQPARPSRTRCSGFATLTSF